eukprot:8225189-Alexandrium_andersonii.AAC.1
MHRFSEARRSQHACHVPFHICFTQAAAHVRGHACAGNACPWKARARARTRARTCICAQARLLGKRAREQEQGQ